MTFLQTLEQSQDKTIRLAVTDGDRYVALHFTDDTVLVLHIKAVYDEAEINVIDSEGLDIDTSLKLKLIDHQEFLRLTEARESGKYRKAKEARHKQYLELKKEFETSD